MYMYVLKAASTACVHLYCRFEPQRAVQQLRACGVLETVRLSAAGYPSRWTYNEFFQRYRLLLRSGQVRRDDVRQMCEYILHRSIKVSQIFIACILFDHWDRSTIESVLVIMYGIRDSKMYPASWWVCSIYMKTGVLHVHLQAANSQYMYMFFYILSLSSPDLQVEMLCLELCCFVCDSSQPAELPR